MNWTRRLCEIVITSIVAGILYAGCLDPVVAQNTQCSDRTAGDSSNACANTRFVGAAIAAAVPVLPNTQIFVGNSSNQAAAVAMSGDCTISNTGIITCAIPLGHIASIGNNTVLGNISGISATPIALSQVQLTALVNPCTGLLAGSVPTSSRVNNFLRDDCTWQAAGSGSSIVQDFLAGVGFTPGTTTALTLSSSPSAAAVLMVSFDGVIQSHNTYTLVGAVLTFNAAIPTNTQVVEAQWYSATGTNPFSGGIVTGATYFQSGRPWADVVAYGAACDNSTDDTAHIQAAINAVNSSGGVVFFPPMSGGCKITSTLNITGNVILKGVSPSTTSLLATTDITMVNFASTVSWGGIQDLAVFGYQNSAATANTVVVQSNALANFDRCIIWGGASAFYTLGVDGTMSNCDIHGYGTCPTCGDILSQGANWYVRVKIDSNTATTNGFYQGSTGATAENHFVQCDFSGSFTNSVTIADGTNTHALTIFEGSIFSSPINIASGKATIFTGAEFGTTTLLNNSTGPMIISGSYAFTGTTATGTGPRSCGANYNITC